MTDETRRFQWPIPAWNADWQKWQERFADLTANIDATVFAVMSNSKLIMKDLPSVEVREPTPGDWILEMKGDAKFVSRNLLTEIVVTQESVALQADSILGLTFTPGAVGQQTASWEVYPQSVSNDPEIVPVGYVDDSYNIIWYNGAEIAAGGGVQKLFGAAGGSGSATDKVKISAADTLANYLQSKLAAGSNITLTKLNPGANEQLEISAPASSVPTGTGVLHVDATNGSDLTGDGSVGNPFASIAYAASTISAPVSYAEFSTPLVFMVAPGTYSADVTLPYRLDMRITGDNVDITGKLIWGYDIQYWYGQSLLTNIPVLSIAPITPLAMKVASIDCKNDAPGNGTIDPYVRWLSIDKCFVREGNILNLESGATGAGECTGGLVLFMDECYPYEPYAFSSGRIGGQRESSFADDPNFIILAATNSQIKHDLCGCTSFLLANGVSFAGDVDYTMDPITGTTPGYAGSIGGASNDLQVGNCSIEQDWKIGWDGVTGSTPGDLVVDANTYGDLAVTNTLTLDNVAVELADVAEGIKVDGSSYTGALIGQEQAQGCFDALDNIPLHLKLAQVTSNTTPTELVNPDGIVIQANGNVGVMFLEADIIAKRANNNIVHRTWTVKAVFQDDDLGSRSIITSPQDKQTHYMSSVYDEASWDAYFEYYDASGTPRVRLMAVGDSTAGNVRWEARVKVVAVQFDNAS